MKREFLKELGFEDEKIDKIMAEHGNTVNSIKSERDILNREKGDLKEEITKRDGQITALSKNAGDAQATATELDRLKGENQNWENKYKKSQLQANVKLSVAKDANDANDILFFVDMEKLSLKDDGSIDGLDEQLKTLKESKPYLFNATSQQDPADPVGSQGDPVDPPAAGQAGFTPGSSQRGNNPKDPDPAALAKADIERRHGKQKEE